MDTYRGSKTLGLRESGRKRHEQLIIWGTLKEVLFLFLMKNQVELELTVLWSISLLKFGEPYSQASAQDIPK